MDAPVPIQTAAHRQAAKKVAALALRWKRRASQNAEKLRSAKGTASEPVLSEVEGCRKPGICKTVLAVENVWKKSVSLKGTASAVPQVAHLQCGFSR